MIKTSVRIAQYRNYSYNRDKRSKEIKKQTDIDIDIVKAKTNLMLIHTSLCLKLQNNPTPLYRRKAASR